MSTGTGGTTAATSLTALRQPGSFITLQGVALSFTELDADIASMNQLIKDDQNFNQPAPGSNAMWGWSRNGVLYVPNRGSLRCLPGDCIMVDAASGWPILVSRQAIAVGGSVWSAPAT